MKGILRRYFLPVLCVAALYAGNRWIFVPHTAGALHRLLAWHFADFLAGGLMLCILNAALELSGRRPLRRWLPILGFSLLCGSFWELVTPLYLPRSIGDWRDVVAVCLGGLATGAILHLPSGQKG